MRVARLEKSERLQRVSLLLQQGGEFTTREIQTLAHVCAVSAAVAELRQNGHDIRCRRDKDLWFYSLGGVQ